MNTRGRTGSRPADFPHTAFSTVVLALVFSSAAAAQPVTFSRDDVPSFAGARAIVSADFNRDGWPDVAHANTDRNSVTILLNQAGAGLVRSTDVAVGAGPFDLVTGDFNRDGVPDLAVANADASSISVLFGTGAPGFTRSDIFVASQNPRGIGTADVNEDGKPDLIYSAYATGQVQVLLGDGAGGFARGPAVAASSARAQGVGTADFNHDGVLDIAVAYASGAGLRILYGSAGGAFTARAVAGASNLNVLAVADFDRDGWDDVAAASTANSIVAIYRGGAGGLVHAQTYPVDASPRGIAVGDLNADGLPDLVTGNRSTSTVSVLSGDAAHPGAFLTHDDVVAGSGSRAVVVADFNGDALPDIATGNEFASSVTVLSNTNTLPDAGYAFRHVPVRGVELTEPSAAVAVADFDRDGRLDFATQGADSNLIVVLLASGPAPFLPTGGLVRALTSADLNSDGNADLLFQTYSSDSLQTYLGNGRGGFVAGPSTPSRSPITLAVADINRDGRVDVVSVGFNPDGSQWLLEVGLGRGDGGFAAPSAPKVVPEHADGLLLADVNRDGRLDAVVLLSGIARGAPCEVRVWFGNGSGGLTASSWNATFIHSYGVSVDLADVDRDGFLDLVASEHQQVGVALGSASGFAAPVYTEVTTADQFLGAIAAGDLDADGQVDVAFGSGDVVFGAGDGRFVADGRFDYGGAASIRIADFTRDGLADILASNERGPTVIGNTRSHTNQSPSVNAGPDRAFDYVETQGEDCLATVTAEAIDPDAHALTYEWRVNGQVISTGPILFVCGPKPGSYVYSVTVLDGRGGTATDSVTVVIRAIEEIVLWAADAAAEGNWSYVNDATAAGGIRVHDANLGAPKVATPLASTSSVVTVRFFADPNQTYKLWIRLKSDGNSWANDSVWVQFSGATDAAGIPLYRVGTTSGLAVNLEECSGCGISGWGWEDDGWGAPDRNGVLLRFAQNPDRDPQSMVIQTREDGVSIDQIVLSAVKYKTTRPGKAKNDATIVPSTQPQR